MTAEQFCLRWNNHQSTLVSVFDGLFESGTLVDCTLAADGQYLKAHKVVLSACSPYLEVLLSQHYDQHPIVILKDVKFEELKAMLEYMYRGEVNVTQEQLGRFLKAAESLKIKGLTNNEVGPGAGHIATAIAATNPSVVVPPVITSGVNNDCRDITVRNRQEPRKTLPPQLPLQQPRSPVLGNQTSLVETLKNAPASLVIDIPPISPVNSKEGSLSPTPQKRRKRNQSQNNEFTQSSESNPKSDSPKVNSASVCEKSDESVLDVDPMAILETGLVKSEVKRESGDQSDEDNDSESENMDEDYDGVSKPGPSNGSSGAADCGNWQGAASSDGEIAESSKGEINKKISMNLLYEHINNVDMNQRISGQYACPNCGKSYVWKQGLNTHKRLHCGKEPNYQCPHCPKRCYQRGNLDSHIRNVHTSLILNKGSASQTNVFKIETLLNN